MSAIFDKEYQGKKIGDVNALATILLEDYSVAVVPCTDFGFSGLSLDDRIFLAQSDVIRKIAEEGPCVIVGRCADYVLRERDDVFNIFVRASMD